MEDIIIEERPATPVSTKEPAKQPEPKVKIKVKKQGPGVLSYLADWFNKSLIVFLLATINFVLFLSVGNLNAFRGAPWEFVPEVSYILLGLFILSWLLMFAASIARFIQNLLAAALVGFWFVVLVNQFALFDSSSFLHNWATNWLGEVAAAPFAFYSQWIAALIIFVVSWLFFTLASNRKQFYLVVVLAAIASISVVKLYNQRNNLTDFYEVYADKVITNNKKGNNFVFIAVPNLPSYRYLEKISPKYNAAKNALSAMLGLYTRNGFVLFPNAYTLAKTESENLAQSLNMSFDADLLVYPPQYDDNWDFSSLTSKRSGLKSNQLLDTFEKNGYVRKVFEDSNAELCFVNGKPTANACYRRGMVPLALNADRFSLRQRTLVLLGQWLGSMNMFALNRPLYNVLKSFNVADVPFIGQDYSELTALGSVKTLDMVADDIAQGKGNRAYVVWLNLPGQGFVYDEFCQLKPVDKWIVKGGVEKDEDKQINAYFEQTACLFGKLADFMRQLKENDADKNTVVVLQGVSGLEIAGLKPADKFEAENMVSMAIRDPKHTKFTINNRFCSAPKIVRQYLFKKDECKEQEGLNLDENVKNELLEIIKKQNVISDDSLNTLSEASEWFRNWLRANYQDMVIPIEMPVPEEKEVEASKLQNPQQAKEKLIKQETKTITEAAQEEAEKVREIKLRTENIVTTSDDNKNVAVNEVEVTTETKSLSNVDAEMSQPQNLLENAVVEEVVAPNEQVLPTEEKANTISDEVQETDADKPTTASQVEKSVEENVDEVVSDTEADKTSGEKAKVAVAPEELEEVSVKSEQPNEEQPKTDVVSQSQNMIIGTEQKVTEAVNDKSAEPEQKVGEAATVMSEKFPDVETALTSKTEPVETKVEEDEKVVIIPQGDDKSDKIIIKIGAEEEENQPQSDVKNVELEKLTAEIIATGEQTKDAMQNSIPELPEIKAPVPPLNAEKENMEISLPQPEMLIPQVLPQQDEIDENVLFERNDSELPEPDKTIQN